jgi:general secretion pathway protein H
VGFVISPALSIDTIKNPIPVRPERRQLYRRSRREETYASTLRLRYATLRANGLLSSHARGFTLLELLIVLVIVGITLGMISFNAMPNDQKVLQNDAQRIALLLQTARDEAIVRNHPIAFEAEPDRYRFLIHDENAWQVLKQDDLLREREFKKSPVTFSISPSSLEQSLPMRIIFGREPVDKPFDLTLSLGEASVVIHADGIGHFTVE